jgi:hypothetical protein
LNTGAVLSAAGIGASAGVLLDLSHGPGRRAAGGGDRRCGLRSSQGALRQYGRRAVSPRTSCVGCFWATLPDD